MITIPNSLKQITTFKNADDRKAFAKMAESRYISPLRMAVRNAGEDVTEIDIEGTIGEDWWAWSEEDFKKNTKENIKDVLRGISTSEIIVNINSYGGDVNHGLSIHDLLVDHEATVTTKINGMTASAATIISQAGDKRIISSNALFLPHRAWTCGCGNYNNFVTLSEDLKTIDEVIAKIYEKKGTQTYSDYLELMDINNGDGKWHTADEVITYGFADSIYQEEEEEEEEPTTPPTPPENSQQREQPIAASANDARIRDQITILQLKEKSL